MSKTVVNSRRSRHIACSLWATRRMTMELSRWWGLLASRSRKPFGRRSETGAMSSFASAREGGPPSGWPRSWGVRYRSLPSGDQISTNLCRPGSPSSP